MWRDRQNILSLRKQYVVLRSRAASSSSSSHSQRQSEEYERAEVEVPIEVEGEGMDGELVVVDDEVVGGEFGEEDVFSFLVFVEVVGFERADGDKVVDAEGENGGGESDVHAFRFM